MKKSIDEWNKLFADAIKRKYPNDFSDQDKRLEYIKQELEDVIFARKVEKGIVRVVKSKSKEGHRYNDPDERIAGLLANIFVLTYLRTTDLDAKLQEALDWFHDLRTK